MQEKQKQPSKFMRVYKEFEPEEVKRHLLLIDDLYGTCANCGQLGLNFTKDKVCPGCKTTFSFLMTKLKNPGDLIKILNRIKTDSLPFTMIEKDDYDRASARDALGDLFAKKT